MLAADRSEHALRDRLAERGVVGRARCGLRCLARVERLRRLSGPRSAAERLLVVGAPQVLERGDKPAGLLVGERAAEDVRELGVGRGVTAGDDVAEVLE